MKQPIMKQPIILLEKDGFLLRSISNTQYSIDFSIENNNIRVEKIIDFSLIKLIYDLNPDIYIYSVIEKISETEANVTLLMKHFFEDIGMPQRYSYVHMTKHIEENQIVFTSRSITDHVPENIPENAKLLIINNMSCTCKIESPHKILFTFDVHFDSSRFKPPPPVERMIGVILNKIFKRVKQFIENVS